MYTTHDVGGSKRNCIRGQRPEETGQQLHEGKGRGRRWWQSGIPRGCLLQAGKDLRRYWIQSLQRGRPQQWRKDIGQQEPRGAACGDGQPQHRWETVPELRHVHQSGAEDGGNKVRRGYVGPEVLRLQGHLHKRWHQVTCLLRDCLKKERQDDWDDSIQDHGINDLGHTLVTFLWDPCLNLNRDGRSEVRGEGLKDCWHRGHEAGYRAERGQEGNLQLKGYLCLCRIELHHQGWQ
mmetsp:Transcript_22357/g.40202  ORF Transcript_22357/g.40202 Transcript_22357/m.40202 type:complete len:235 (-) Transcript_22357:2286-2990(-)